MKVCILAKCRNLDLLPATLMVFDTLRVGFPTADVEVTIPNTSMAPKEIEAQAKACGASVCYKGLPEFEHPWWIHSTMSPSRAPGPLIILDTDVVFWSNCEGLKFKSCLAGCLCPKFYDPFVQAITMPRLHTSFLWINDVSELWRNIPKSRGEATALSPFNPFNPFIYYHEGKRYFQDTCGALYQAIGGEAFRDEHLACYDHLHNGTILDLVAPSMDNPGAYRRRQMAALKNPTMIRNSWPLYAAYYKSKEVYG